MMATEQTIARMDMAPRARDHGRGRWRSAGLGAVLAFVLGGLVCATAALAQAPTEYQVKAAFLFNFTKFVDWPASAWRAGQGPITICLVGEDHLGKTLDELVKGQNVGGRTLAVRRLAQAPIPRDDSCQMAFLAGLDRGRAEQQLAPVKGLPILIVVDHEDGGDPGAMIGFVVEDNKVRFNINLDAAERAGIKISSKLLKLAKTVREKGGR